MEVTRSTVSARRRQVTLSGRVGQQGIEAVFPVA
jgi:hypothetical protein